MRRFPSLCRLSALWPALVAIATATSAAAGPPPPETTVAIDGQPVLPMHGTTAGFWLFAQDEGAQLALMGHPPCRAVASLDQGRQITICAGVAPVAGPRRPTLRIVPLDAASAETRVWFEPGRPDAAQPAPGGKVWIEISSPHGPASIRLEGLALIGGAQPVAVAWQPKRRLYPQSDAVACSPPFRPAIEQALIDWDWRMQDGIQTPRQPHSYLEAIVATLARGKKLCDDLAAQGVLPAGQKAAWTALSGRCDRLNKAPAATDAAAEALWLDVHRWRRQLALANPAADVGPLVFVKQVPSTMSHQLTQYYGYTARPGGGLFVLSQPGRSMRVQRLAAALPSGSCMHPEVSPDAGRIYFAFCSCDTAPASWGDPKAMERHYHLYAVRAGGGAAEQLTDGPYDDFSPKCLPGGKLLFVSTRRGGFHRCGRGPCYVYSLALAEADGSNPRPISFHETNEWDPAVLHDGRVIYTRWDYVDRNAVFYQQLWSVWQDGSHVRIYYGNNTYNPVGTWEARPIPGSNRVMATAAPHHGMTAGSIILLDVTRGVDGPASIVRLTPDALFPEAESRLAGGIPADKPTAFDDEFTKGWGPQGPSQATRLKVVPEEERRWPGHCYRSAWPISEKYFLAAYSFDRLRGEPGVNLPNLFGLYLCDAFGNKELLYRDPNISSQWPMPLRPRPRPPVLELPSHWAESTPGRPEGTFFLENVYASWPKLPEVEICRLRVVQVLPKTTPHINTPRVGAANASPGKQVLGTVPVERDGSAYFRVPARVPVMFQALDARGRAVQTMRSLAYLQPGEQVSCVGCHEPRHSTASTGGASGTRGGAGGTQASAGGAGGTQGTAGGTCGAMAITRPPSTIRPGPPGSRPLSYPLLVQPVLDRHCVACHKPQRPEGQVVLTGEPAGSFSRSYNALIPWVSYTAWGNPAGNYEPLTAPDRFGARASKLTQLLDRGHYEVRLSPEEWDRIVTWMDANALFYGTFNPRQQARQLRGETIAGPDLE